jgi:hypothetical protein
MIPSFFVPHHPPRQGEVGYTSPAAGLRCAFSPKHLHIAHTKVLQGSVKDFVQEHCAVFGLPEAARSEGETYFASGGAR